MYEYKFIGVPLKKGFRVKTGDTLGPGSTAYCYQIVFEKEIK